MKPKLIKFDDDLLALVEVWRSEQKPVPAFSEAVRRLVQTGLGKAAPAPATPAKRISDGLEDAIKWAKEHRRSAPPDPWREIIGPITPPPGSRLKKK